MSDPLIKLHSVDTDISASHESIMPVAPPAQALQSTEGHQEAPNTNSAKQTPVLAFSTQSTAAQVMKMCISEPRRTVQHVFPQLPPHSITFSREPAQTIYSPPKAHFSTPVTQESLQSVYPPFTCTQVYSSV